MIEFEFYELQYWDGDCAVEQVVRYGQPDWPSFSFLLISYED